MGIKKRETQATRGTKLLVLYLMLIILVIIFLSSVYRTMNSQRQIPSKMSTIQNRSLRGDILSKDGYLIASSYKFYQAVVHSKSIRPEKKELFVKLFSIYSGIDEEKIYSTFYTKRGILKKGYVTLAKDINARQSMQLKSLSSKLYRLGVFQSIKNSKNIDVVHGLDIVESGEARRYPLLKSMTPIIGYVKNKLENRYSLSKGQKGIEKYAQKYLTISKNGMFKGPRDVIGYAIHNGESSKINRVNGLDVHLNISLPLQQSIEAVLDDMKIETGASEILGAVMESKTGKVLAMASSNRYNPSHITQKDVYSLNPKFSEYPYEAGSVIKPLTLSIALDYKRVTPTTWFETFDGKMKISARKTITDDEKFKALTATDIIVHSSNVGISQIAWKLTGSEFRDGLLKFGLSQPSGIDLSRDLAGKIKSVRLLNNKLHRANQSYGYGMHITFTQLMRAYSAFNNGGMAMSPRIIDYFTDSKDKKYRLAPPKPDKRAISSKTSEEIHTILQEVVKRGTGVAGQYKGLDIGGKTGTAHIATSAGYTKSYHSSFFGFANDKFGKKYTIGVLVIKATKPFKYFASMSAVPTFKQITQALVEYEFLVPKLSKAELAEIAKEEAGYLKDKNKEKCITNKLNTKICKPKNIYIKPKYKIKKYKKIKIYKPVRKKIKPKIYKKHKNKKVKKQEPIFNDLDMF
ncbi:Cell division protein FtsI [Peptidoglycan synthetase] [hydrothermal vent metagenome]|uniref:Cell division protein FtsI [Peptidoglycan synthetase] n=1 Tax=hydrothermal vent metagenome TaxID=652676 RepID=A0A1W1BI24_9ZZZZ